ncbi:MAG TPA: hypothetical protein VEC37_05330 [Bacillota bacterium]|nr:hypothetical protein [Bacillota bacterium]
MDYLIRCEWTRCRKSRLKGKTCTLYVNDEPQISITGAGREAEFSAALLWIFKTIPEAVYKITVKWGIKIYDSPSYRHEILNIAAKELGYYLYLVPVPDKDTTVYLLTKTPRTDNVLKPTKEW